MSIEPSVPCMDGTNTVLRDAEPRGSAGLFVAESWTARRLLGMVRAHDPGRMAGTHSPRRDVEIHSPPVSGGARLPPHAASGQTRAARADHREVDRPVRRARRRGVLLGGRAPHAGTP